MSFRLHVLGHLVRLLRTMRLSGAGVAELTEMLAKRGVADVSAARYFAEAFAGSTARISLFMELDPSPDGLEQAVGRLIDDRRSIWETTPFPELMRLRDYFSFLELAQRTNRDIYVCGANPMAGALIGKAGYRCYDGRLFVVSRQSQPNAGAIAADPQDPRLVAALSKYATPMTYEGYLDLLRMEGLRVLGPDEGFVIEDGNASRLYAPYRLHGVYECEGHASAWRGREGEQMRHALNQSLGTELVRFGPHDDWEYRNDPEIAGPLWGPQPPVICFEPNGQIEDYTTLERMARYSGYTNIWSRLYPHHPVGDSGGTR